MKTSKLSITITPDDLPSVKPAQVWIELDGCKVAVSIGKNIGVDVTSWIDKRKFNCTKTHKKTYKY